MIQNLTQTIITILMFGLFLLLSVVAMAQSAAPPGHHDEGDKRDIGHQPQPEHIEDYTKGKPESAVDPKKPSSSANPSNSAGAKPSGPSGADQKNPASGTGGSTRY
ncbi:MAG: hypothetical protein JSR32_06305 [Proteobacteria bacterium]|jgi:hypothetical protein|nr:hypothetical protein [Pseudomonadota bacterium]